MAEAGFADIDRAAGPGRRKFKRMDSPAKEEEKRKCTKCKEEKIQKEFSRKQWQNGKTRKCNSCTDPPKGGLRRAS